MVVKKRKPAKKAAKKKTGTGTGLKRYQSFIKKKTAVPERKIKALEKKLAQAQREKKARTKKAQAEYRRKTNSSRR